MRALPDIEHLKALGVTPHYFGLGFIQLKLDDTRRLHFWVPEWPTIPGSESELHDHRYDFSSSVLKGAVEHDIFALGPVHATAFEGCLELVHVTCKPGGAQEPQVVGYTQAVPIGTFEITAGCTYHLSQEAFHRAHSIGPTVTYVERSAVTRELARVVRTPGAAFTCPFSLTFSAEECWSKINDILRA